MNDLKNQTTGPNYNRRGRLFIYQPARSIWRRLLLAAALLCLCQTLRAAPGYVMGQALTVNVAGENVQFTAGQNVTVLGIVNGSALVRVTLSNGAVSIAQVPATALVQAAAPSLAAPRPAPAPVFTPAPTPAAFPRPTFPPMDGADQSADLGEDALDAAPGLKIYVEPKARATVNQFAVYIPPSYKPATPMPLLVDAHGNGGSGPKEIKQWEMYADQIGFIVVCPSFQSSVLCSDEFLKSDDKMLSNVMKRVLGSFNIDRKHILFTGFSGGGFATFYLASKDSQIFTALCFRSGNFGGEGTYNVKASFAPWRHRPVYMYLAEHDNPAINAQDIDGLAFLKKKVDPENLKYDMLPASGHQSRPEYAAKWFQTLIQTPDASL